MSVLDVIYDRYSEEELSHLISLDSSTLMRASIQAMREAEQEEKHSSDTPGKTAISYVLNQKYEVIEDGVLQTHLKDIICKSLDRVLDKLAYKYRVQRKGKNFIFSEGMFCIANPSEEISSKEQLLAAIYAEKQKLHALNIQLARLNPQNDEYLRVAIRKQESIIKALHNNLADTIGFRNESLVTRLKNILNSLTEEKKNELASTAAYTAAGSAAGGAFGRYAIQRKAKARWDYDAKMKKHNERTTHLDLVTKDYYDAKKQKGRNNSLLNRQHNLIKDYEAKLKTVKGRSKEATAKRKQLNTIIDKLKAAKERLTNQQNAVNSIYKNARNEMPMAAGAVHRSKIETVDRLNKALKRVGKKGLKKGALVGAGLGLTAKALSYRPDRRK